MKTYSFIDGQLKLLNHRTEDPQWMPGDMKIIDESIDGIAYVYVVLTPWTEDFRYRGPTDEEIQLIKTHFLLNNIPFNPGRIT